MAIYKAVVHDKYATIPNETLQDSSVSFEARGLLAALKAAWQEEAFGIAAQICEKKANEYANGNYEHGSRQHGKIVAANSCAYEIRAYVIRQREQVAGDEQI